METTVEKAEKKSKVGKFVKAAIVFVAGVTAGVVAYKRYGSGTHTIGGDFKALGNKIMPKRKTEPVVEQPVQERPQQYGGGQNGNRFQSNNGRFNNNN